MPFWRLFYHLVWATKHREPLIGTPEEAAIRRSFALTVAELDVVPHAIGFMPDHGHVVVSAPPKIAPAELARRLKGASTHAVNTVSGRVDAPAFSWQGEYGVLSFGEQALPAVLAYVNDQPARHASGNLWPTIEVTSEA